MGERLKPTKGGAREVGHSILSDVGQSDMDDGKETVSHEQKVSSPRTTALLIEVVGR
jgi:hypothetical protein